MPVPAWPHVRASPVACAQPWPTASGQGRWQWTAPAPTTWLHPRPASAPAPVARRQTRVCFVPLTKTSGAQARGNARATREFARGRRRHALAAGRSSNCRTCVREPLCEMKAVERQHNVNEPYEQPAHTSEHLWSHITEAVLRARDAPSQRLCPCARCMSLPICPGLL